MNMIPKQFNQSREGVRTVGSAGIETISSLDKLELKGSPIIGEPLCEYS